MLMIRRHGAEMSVCCHFRLLSPAAIDGFERMPQHSYGAAIFAMTLCCHYARSP